MHDDFAADTAALARCFEQPPVLVGASLGGLSSILALGEAGAEPLASALVLVDIATRMEFDGAARHLVLAHLSENNNSPEVARLAATQALERRCVRFPLSVAGPPEIHVTPRTASLAPLRF